MIEWMQILLISFGVFFYLIGTLGILRFPDVFTRLHALTKADNLGLGLVMLGVLPSLPSIPAALKVVLCWLLILASSAVATYLIAKRAAEDQAS
ncbi:MAG: monovalent cation/H(+) antiporter subunit G [Idiomarina sp.]|nr:monovalent cation/H(+) antiporter subunit G [Idiomarina sp.]